MIKIIFKVSFLLLTSCFFFLSFNLFSEEIEEIVVKGKIKEVNLNKSNTSLVILEKSLIDEEPIKHFEQLSFLVPNLNFSGSDSRARYFQIRGIGERSQYAGEGGPIYYVGTVIDDIDVSGIGMAIFLDNVKQIEVYQGPQSYAYGHNAMAGLININTNDPTEDEYDEFRLTLGNDNLFKASYYKDYEPILNNKLLLNQFIYYSSQNGFMYNTFLNDYKNNKSEYFQKLKYIYRLNDNLNSKL